MRKNGRQSSLNSKSPKEVGGFEIIEKLGQGGMGAVFKARQKTLDRVVALKILPPSVASDKVFIERFVREARASARLSHPNVVAGIDVGQDAATGLWYFAMELVEGPSARQLVKERGRLPEDEALKIVRDIAAALECARQNGIVHRDVKPDNILLDANGNARLADLGLARQTNDDANLTQSGVAMGTPFYMAPEQVRGELENLDTRADLYALGATLFHLVTGELPFRGETSAVIMAQHLTQTPPLASRVCADVSPGCTKLIEKLMQKDKARRIQTPAELIKQIDALLTKRSVSARARTTGPRAPVKGIGTTASQDAVRSRRKRSPEGTKSSGALFAGVGAVIVVLVILASVLFTPSAKPKRSDRHAEKSGPVEGLSPATSPLKAEPRVVPPQGPASQQSQSTESSPAANPRPIHQSTEDTAPKAEPKGPLGLHEQPNSAAEKTKALPPGKMPPDLPRPEEPDAKRTALHPDVERRWTEIITRFDQAMLEAKDEAAAIRIAREARDAEELDPIRPQANALMAILEASKRELRRQEEAIAQLKGRGITIDGAQGLIDRVSDGALYVKIALDGEKIVATKKLKLSELTEAQQKELIPPLKIIPDALCVARALQALAQGPERLDAADKQLATVPDFPLTPHYQALIRARKEAALQAQAKAAWEKIVTAAAPQFLKQEQALQLLEQLNAFSNTYGKCSFVTERAEEIAVLRSKLDGLANPNISKKCKTLVTWVHLANTTQRGGSALTVQVGQQFDAVVFGEKQPGKWIAGSDFFRRTPNNQGAYAAETANPATLIQMAIVYDEDRITIYRNAEQLVSYSARNIDLVHGRGSTVVFGLRHIGTAHGANLQGAIEDARVYDRCLTAEQIKTLVPNKPSVVPPWAWWDFEDGKMEDRMSRYTRKVLTGNARVENGKLILDTRNASLQAFRPRNGG